MMRDYGTSTLYSDMKYDLLMLYLLILLAEENNYHDLERILPSDIEDTTHHLNVKQKKVHKAHEQTFMKKGMVTMVMGLIEVTAVQRDKDGYIAIQSLDSEKQAILEYLAYIIWMNSGWFRGTLFLKSKGCCFRYGAGRTCEDVDQGICEESPTMYDVILESITGKDIQVIRVLRLLLDLGLRDAMRFCDILPRVILTGVFLEEAFAVKLLLEPHGAKVCIRESRGDADARNCPGLPDPEPTHFNVAVDATDAHRLDAYRIIRTLTSESAEGALNLINSSPRPVMEKVPREILRKEKDLLDRFSSIITITPIVPVRRAKRTWRSVDIVQLALRSRDQES